jgi:hypothetical protein
MLGIYGLTLLGLVLRRSGTSCCILILSGLDRLLWKREEIYLQSEHWHLLQ